MIHKLYVHLKIPDTTAITALQTLHRMGYTQVTALDRFDYYEFTVLNEEQRFKKEIAGVDVLVNANKHQAILVAEGEEPHLEGASDILVTDKELEHGKLFHTLTKRLGLDMIETMRHGTLWRLHIADPDRDAIASAIAKDLLCNAHYQEFTLQQ